MTGQQLLMLLRAKEGEYEDMFKQRLDRHSDELCFMMADMSLLFGLVATHVEQQMESA